MGDADLLTRALAAGVEGLDDRDIPATWLNLVVASVKQHVHYLNDPVDLAGAFATAAPIVTDSAPPRVADDLAIICAGAVGYLRSLMLVAARPDLSADAKALHREVLDSTKRWTLPYWQTLMDWAEDRLHGAIEELARADLLTLRRGKLYARPGRPAG